MAKRLNRKQIAELAEGKPPIYVKGIGRTMDCEEVIIQLAQRLKRYQDNAEPCPPLIFSLADK